MIKYPWEKDEATDALQNDIAVKMTTSLFLRKLCFKNCAGRFSDFPVFQRPSHLVIQTVAVSDY